MMLCLYHALRQSVQRVRLFVFILLLYSMAACQGFAVSSPDPVQSSPVPRPVEETVLPLPEEVLSPQAAEADCAFVWVSQDLPEVADVLRKVLLEAGLPEDIEAYASAFGENCIDPATGRMIRFLPMQTDFGLVIPVDSIDDVQKQGELIEEILLVFGQFPADQVPGPNIGYLKIRFLGKSAEANLSFSLEYAQELLRDGLRGSALYRALASP